MLLSSEIAEEYDVKDTQVLTPNGWRNVLKVYKTKPIETLMIVTETHELVCSLRHMIKTPNGWVTAQSLCQGDIVCTDTGDEVVLLVDESGDIKELYDITIDDPSGEFYSDGIVSHNSTTFAARQLILSHLLPNYKSLYVCPQHDQLKTYARRLAEMESAFRFDNGKQNLYNKVFTDGSAIDLNYCLTSANAVRGKSVTEVLLDEAQGINPDIVPELLYVQTTAQYPSTIFAGTALSIDTLLEAKWQASSMGMWHVRSMDDSHWLNMYDKDTLEKVCNNPQGPTCPYTGKLLDVTRGCYVHANQKSLAINEVGIHVPQCIIPDLAYNSIQWGKIYKKIQDDDFNKVLQECFGIAVAEGSREITEQDLQRLCVLTDTPEQLKAKCRNGFYRLIISGCDWGGSDYNQAIKSKTSYTVHCIIGVAPDDTVDILYYKRFSGMDYREIAEEIVNAHNAYNGNLVASDFGVGLAYNTELRNRIPFNKHYIMNYVGPATVPLSTPKGDHMYNQLALNRTEALTNVFKDVKAPHLKIKAPSWGKMSTYLLDWLNMYRVPTETPSGQATFKYIRSATKADDALHAFTFAYVLAKFFLGVPLVQDLALEKKLRDSIYGGSPAPMQSPELDRLLRGGDPNYIISL